MIGKNYSDTSILSLKAKLAVAFCLLLSLQSVAQNSNKTLRVFLIGNSFSQNATRYLPQIAKEGGYTIVLGHAEPGGCSLQRHWDSVEVSLQDTSRGKLYKNQSLRTLLSKGKWDVVTIQQYSLLSGDTATYQPYADKLTAFIKQLQPEANVYIHETWPYRADAKTFGRIAGAKTAKSQGEMYAKLSAAYRQLSADLSLPLIPSGDAFYTVSTNPQWQFQKDVSFDAEAAIQPALPADKNSLHVGYTWGNDGKLKFDANHASEAGCYLAGLVWYATLFKEDPRTIHFKPVNVPDDFASFLKQTAWQTVQQTRKQ